MIFFWAFDVQSFVPEFCQAESQFYTQVRHMKGSVVKSSHIYQGWSVNPQLENVPWRISFPERKLRPPNSENCKARIFSDE